MESLILTNNSMQELGDLDSLSSLKSLTYVRYVPELRDLYLLCKQTSGKWYGDSGTYM
jgi:hypothetical protein